VDVFVTGAGGFLGGAVVRRLIERGDRVRGFSRRRYSHLDRIGVKQHQGDLAESGALSRAMSGCELVFHIASKIDMWGAYEDFFRTNVIGTQNVVAACRENEVHKLVYTSTPSVVHGGGHVNGLDESAPYPDHYETHYPKTKAEAEKYVLRANDESLATVALRPHLIWGPGDPNLVPRLVERAKTGRLVKAAGGPYLVDSVFIDNAADAHLLAADKLDVGSIVAGKAYFITQGEPMDIGELIDRIIGAAGLPPVKKQAPAWLLTTAGYVTEHVYRLFRPTKEPPMTAFIARQLSTAHWFDISAARRDLGYHPSVSMEVGLEKLRRWLIDPGAD
jgi:2-alkyl-3-oxoalkanoate reductase